MKAKPQRRSKYGDLNPIPPAAATGRKSRAGSDTHPSGNHVRKVAPPADRHDDEPMPHHTAKPVSLPKAEVFGTQSHRRRTDMKFPSRFLHTAIPEAIHAHADRYRGGKIDLDRALSALGEAATRLLAEIPDTRQRIDSANALIIGIARTVRTQIDTEHEVNTTNH
jgi:hypothetical protein